MGGNQGNREANLTRARELIRQRCGVILKSSAIYETAAWGNEQQPPFLNQALQVETELSAIEVLRTILGIEQEIGRVRKERFGPRSIDIDLLLYDDDIHDSRELTIPHPRLHLRRFVLVPLSEIAAETMHPLLHLSVRELLEKCPDELEVREWGRN